MCKMCQLGHDVMDWQSAGSACSLLTQVRSQKHQYVFDPLVHEMVGKQLSQS